jgi:methionine synthase I (cobalamin-dependent)
VETFQRFSTFLKRKQRFIITHTATSEKAVHAAYFEAGADIVETTFFQERLIGHRQWKRRTKTHKDTDNFVNGIEP